MPVSIWDRLQNIPKLWLYGILILAATVPLFLQFPVPNEPSEPSIALYKTLMEIPEGSTVLFSSDWTLSTRGESRAAFDAIVRILMRHHVKLAIYSGADPQAPQVATDELARLNAMRIAEGQPEYKRWTDWINLGFFPSIDNTNMTLARSVAAAFASKTDINPEGNQENVFDSPVLKGISKIQQVSALIDVTASSTTTSNIQRLSGKVKLAFAVTGVMGPETEVYYLSGQVSGLSIGIKGAYDLETLMEKGVNEPGPDGKIAVRSSKFTEPIPGFPGMQNYGLGKTYYPSLHATLALMILAVIVGNIGMFVSRSKNKKVAS